MRLYLNKILHQILEVMSLLIKEELKLRLFECEIRALGGSLQDATIRVGTAQGGGGVCMDVCGVCLFVCVRLSCERV